LDVVLQRDILSEIAQLQEQLGFSILFITHDMSVLLAVSSRLAIMYAGRLIEVGSSVAIRSTPAHPYTRGLLGCFPPLRGPKRPLTWISGSPPDLRHPQPGCPYMPRCPQATAKCSDVDMRLRPTSPDDAGHSSACPFAIGNSDTFPCEQTHRASPS
jgi:oligopeptide/dipeptide ABC transporter ATP-binding protein